MRKVVFAVKDLLKSKKLLLGVISNKIIIISNIAICASNYGA